MAILAVAPNRTFCRAFGAEAADVSITDDYADVNMAAAANDGVTLDFTAQSKVWAHVIYRAASGYGSIIRLLDGSTEVFRFFLNAGDADIYLESSLEGDGVFSVTTSSDVTYDVLLDLDAGNVELYADGSLQWSTTHSFTATTVDALRITSQNTNARYRELIVADESTIGMRLDVRTPTGAGASADQVSGTFADVDDQAPDTASAIVLDTDDRALFTVDAAATIPSGLVRRAVVVAAEARKGASGPANLRLTTRSSSTNTDSGQIALSESYARYQHVFDAADDPDEIGVVAQT